MSRDGGGGGGIGLLRAEAHAASSWVHELSRTVVEIADGSTTLSSLSAEKATPLWALGLCLMVLGTFGSSFGLICMKRSDAVKDLPWYKNGYFWGGLFLFGVTAALLDVIVFSITPLALIAPFSGLTIAVTFVIAYLGCCGVREQPSRSMLVAVVLVVCGVTICSIFGPKTDGEIYPQKLQVTFDTHPWLIVLCALGGFLFGLFALLSYPPASLKDHLPGQTAVAAMRSWWGALTLAILAALFGALTQLQFKAVAAALFSAVRGLSSSPKEHEKLYSSTGEFFVQLLSLASSALAQIGFLKNAVSAAPVAYSVPAYQSALLVLTLVLSGWVLNEYDAMPWLHNLLFWVGVVLVVMGMLLNAWALVRDAEQTSSASAAAGAAAGGGGSPWKDDGFGGPSSGVGGYNKTLPLSEVDMYPLEDDAENASAARKQAAKAKYG